MTTAANLLVILGFLSALYALLGVLCAIAEYARTMLSRRPVRRRTIPSTKRGTVRRKYRRPRPKMQSPIIRRIARETVSKPSRTCRSKVRRRANAPTYYNALPTPEHPL